MEIYSSIQGLLHLAITNELIQPEDEMYCRNQILSLLSLDSYPESMSSNSKNNLADILDKIIDYATRKGIINDLFDEKEIFSSKIMNVFIPRPSDVNKTFYQKYNHNPKTATDYFYQLSQNSNYIQVNRISKNINYQAPTFYGNLDITINLSKPEKDPKQIELERRMSATSNYPTCLLCLENEGYMGRVGHPARSNHRMVRIVLAKEDWLFQYSPYVYYNEHCILLSKIHCDMKIDQTTFARLLDFVEKFPHYFIGSNADLPIVGGSILSHDHYQGGNYDFAMAKAEDEYVFKMSKYPLMKASIIKWPMSVIRLRGNNKDELIHASNYILETWMNYSDESVDIKAYTEDTRHNTITPIARMKNGEYEMDLVLRNNRTTIEYPMGIFHPHEDVHHIKKENIGLIEVMGLAVLPARLDKELTEVKKFLLEEVNEIETYHLSWAEEIKLQYKSELTSDSVNDIIKNELAKKFLKVLEDAGVYKRTAFGREAFRRFTSLL
ncbi:UDP-glucose--hexose-1-phosphate uridylyltransferase [Bacillus sp. OAE603]|uniref:UDP-glucose--hexose-1-phosphate uridylyltransferase n=1 Tax=Gottfriedia sp. OAE603 TaxID=2663872 RepID=UPI0017894B62